MDDCHDGNNADFTLRGVVSKTTTYINLPSAPSKSGSLFFNGKDSYMSLPGKGGHLDLVSSFTLIFNMYIEAYPTKKALLLGYNPAGVGVRVYYENKRVSVYIPSRTATVMKATDELMVTQSLTQLKNWHAIGIVYDYNRQELKLQAGGRTATARAKSKHTVATVGDVRIGGFGKDYFHGSISCLQFYSKVMTSTEMNGKANCRDRKFYCGMV